MDSLKNKLDKNIEIFNTQLNHFNLKKTDTIKTKGVYERLINSVIGEFDLYLQNESEVLKVYFPNGSFIIRNFKDENNQELIEINVEGKSRRACEKMMNELELVYNHMLDFIESKAAQYA